MPIEPSGASDWASKSTIAQVKEAHEIKETLQSVFLVSRVISGTVLGRAIRDHVAEHGIPLLDRCITNRVSFAEALTVGKTIFEHEPRGEAAQEFTHLMEEIGALYDQDDGETETAEAAHG